MLMTPIPAGSSCPSFEDVWEALELDLSGESPPPFPPPLVRDRGDEGAFAIRTTGAIAASSG